MDVEQTKGYYKIRGEIYGVSKEPYENNSSRTLNLTLKTAEGNRVGIKVGKWLNSSLTLKMKCEGMDEAVELNEQEAIDEIRASFNEGDSVFTNCRAEINTYNKGSVDFYINQIYIADKKIDFKAGDFEETNELNIPAIIIGKAQNGKIEVAFADYKGEMLKRILSIEDKDMYEYLEENAQIGDLMKFMIKVVHKPIYDKTEDKQNNSEEKVRKTFKGRQIGGNNSKGKIVGVDEIYTLTDIDLEKVEKAKYTKEDLISILSNNEVSDSDMPF